MFLIFYSKKGEALTVVVMLLVAVAVASVSGYAIWTRSYQAQIQDSVQDSGDLTDSIKHYLCVMECEARFDSPGKEGCIVECYNEEHTPDIGEFALQFDGNKTHVEIPASNNLNINGSEITVEAWVRWNIEPTTGNQWANIVYKTHQNWERPHYQLQHDEGNTKFEFCITTSNHKNIYVWSTTTPEKDIWYHVVGTYDGSNIRIYVNGEFENSKACTGNFDAWDAPISFGSRKLYNDRYFNGTIDRVLIYSRALSDQEILASYNRQQVNSEGLEGKWLFEEGGGETVFDSSGNGNDGTIHGAERT